MHKFKTNGLGGALCLVLVMSPASGQTTKTDLATQAKSADLSNMGPTKPAQTGGTLPLTCSVGEVFFLTTAVAGANLNVCTAGNAWSQAGAGRVIVQADGTDVAATTTLNLTSTSGSTVALNQAGAGINIAVAPDSAIFATRAGVQSGRDSYCASGSASSTTYTCTQQKPLTTYTEGMRIVWAPDAGCAGGVPLTLDVDGNGARRILQNDGNADPLPNQCSAHSQVLLTYSGALNNNAGGWRMMSGPGGSSPVIPRMIAYPFDGGGIVLTPGKTVYIPDIPFSCTVVGWSLAVDQGTATADIWVGADGTTNPTSANSITASARPSITTGTRVRSNAMPGWTTLLSAHSSLAFQLVSVTGATQATVGVECDQ